MKLRTKKGKKAFLESCSWTDGNLMPSLFTPHLHSSFQFCNPLLAQRLQGQSAGAYTWVALSFMHEVEVPSASLGHCPNRYEPTMVSSEEVRRTRGCRGREVFSTAAAQGTLARQGGKEKKLGFQSQDSATAITINKPTCTAKITRRELAHRAWKSPFIFQKPEYYCF